MNNTKAEHCRLLLFAKQARAGHVKTRLQPALSDDKVLVLYKAMLNRALASLHACGLGRVELWVDDAEHIAFTQNLLERFPETECFVQRGEDLGARMQHAFLYRPASTQLVIGTDCPAIDAAYLNSALAALAQAEVVLGPAKDGGYVLLGSRQQTLPLFDNVDWGTSKVLDQSVSALDRKNIKYCLLEALSDIDRPQDLEQLAAFPELAKCL